MTQVMQGIRVLEVAEHTFVPLASAVLADWGAEVIKIEHVTRGDAMRGLMMTGTVQIGDDVHVLLEHSNRGKKSLGLDLTTSEGAEVLAKIAATCDVFLTNKPPAMRRHLGIDVDALRAANPAIVYVAGTAFGPKGPEGDAGGYDFTGFWARSGNAMAAKRDQERVPQMPGPAYGDSIGGMTIAGGIAAALLHRERTGEATEVEVSLLATGVWAMGPGISMSDQMGEPWGQGPFNRENLRNPLVGFYETADHKWLAFSVLQAFHYWPDACAVLGHPEWVDDPRFATHELLSANAPEAHDLVAEALASRPYDEWLVVLKGFSGQWTPVNDTMSVVHDPQVEANGYVAHLKTPGGKPYVLATTPVQFGGEAHTPGRAPDFNEHGDEILQGVGLDMDEIIDLKIKGVVA